MNCRSNPGANAVAGFRSPENSQNGRNDGESLHNGRRWGQWASVFAMSERNLARPVVKETVEFFAAGVTSSS